MQFIYLESMDEIRLARMACMRPLLGKDVSNRLNSSGPGFP